MLRPYQNAALQAVGADLSIGRSTMVVLPTGTGKTVLFSAVAERRRKLGRVLVLAHREELLEQAKEKIEAHTSLRVVTEAAERRVHPAADWDVAVASVQTLSRERRLQRFPADTFGTVIVDECHHAVSEGYKRILGHFASARVLGVTATADRLDRRSVTEVFERVAFSYTMADAIADGWLSPIRMAAIRVSGLDGLNKVKIRQGDYDASELSDLLTSQGAVQQIAWPTIELAGDRSTILFAASVRHAEALAECLNRHRTGCAAVVHGDMEREERKRVLAGYKAGDIQFIANCAVLTEGFDAPRTSCVVMGRPTKSRALYVQCVGRGARLAPGKVDCLVVETHPEVNTHSLSITLDDILPPAQPKPKNDNGGGRDGEEEGDGRPVEEYDTTPVKVAYTAEMVNPFARGGFNQPRISQPWRPATEAQIQAILKRGGTVKPGLTMGEASAIISRATPKQAQTLARFGYDASTMTPAEVKGTLNALAANGWRRLEAS